LTRTPNYFLQLPVITRISNALRSYITGRRPRRAAPPPSPYPLQNLLIKLSQLHYSMLKTLFLMFCRSTISLQALNTVRTLPVSVAQVTW
jgi:hypothetical protein